MTAKKIAEPTVHKDIFGRLIEEGSYVAFPHSNSLYIGTVGKCTAKMVRVHPVVTSSYRSSSGYLKYANELVTVAGTDVTFYVLKNSK
jgi:hypothetical protein